MNLYGFEINFIRFYLCTVALDRQTRLLLCHRDGGWVEEQRQRVRWPWRSAKTLFVVFMLWNVMLCCVVK